MRATSGPSSVGANKHHKGGREAGDLNAIRTRLRIELHHLIDMQLEHRQLRLALAVKESNVDRQWDLITDSFEEACIHSRMAQFF